MTGPAGLCLIHRMAAFGPSGSRDSHPCFLGQLQLVVKCRRYRVPLGQYPGKSPGRIPHTGAARLIRQRVPDDPPGRRPCRHGRTAEPDRPEGIAHFMPSPFRLIADRGGMVVGHDLIDIAHRQPLHNRSSARTCSSPPTPKRRSKPPASRKADRRTTVPHAAKPTIGTPALRPWDASANGLVAMARLSGSSFRCGPTRIRAARRPSAGSLSKRSAARVSAPGCHQKSSSLNATYGVAAAETPTFRPAPPRFSSSAMTSTMCPIERAASAVPSEERLSTTMTGGRSGRFSRCSSAVRIWSLRFRVIMTTVIRVSGIQHPLL